MTQHMQGGGELKKIHYYACWKKKSGQQVNKFLNKIYASFLDEGGEMGCLDDERTVKWDAMKWLGDMEVVQSDGFDDWCGSKVIEVKRVVDGLWAARRNQKIKIKQRRRIRRLIEEEEDKE